MAKSSTRRALLTGAAAIPLAMAVGVPAGARTVEDPAFVAIARHRRAAAASDATSRRIVGDDAADLIYEADSDALAALLRTTPTTLAGCAAMLQHVGAYCAKFDCGPFDDWVGGRRNDIGEAGADFLPMIVAALAAIEGRASA